MKACLPSKPMYCSREYQTSTRLNQQNEKSTSNIIVHFTRVGSVSSPILRFPFPNNLWWRGQCPFSSHFRILPYSICCYLGSSSSSFQGSSYGDQLCMDLKIVSTIISNFVYTDMLILPFTTEIYILYYINRNDPAIQETTICKNVLKLTCHLD